MNVQISTVRNKVFTDITYMSFGGGRHSFLLSVYLGIELLDSSLALVKLPAMCKSLCYSVNHILG